MKKALDLTNNCNEWKSFVCSHQIELQMSNNNDDDDAMMMIATSVSVSVQKRLYTHI